MSDPLSRLLAWYRRHERVADIGFWAAVLLAEITLNSLVSWIDLRRHDPAQPFWEPLMWELTSNAVVGALIPLVVWWERRHPVRWATWPGWLGWHLAGSAGYLMLHVAGMVALRALAYQALGHAYEFPDLGRMLTYEYLKDVRAYASFLVTVLGWRFLLVRSQGEASVLAAPEPPPGEAAPPASPARPERFLVRKLRKEFLVPAADIDHLQAQGNYVGLRVNGHDYLLRSTLSDFLEQLDPARFVRVHRSWAVNLDRIAEIEPLDSGDARLRLRDGSVVPCSRRYRDALGTAR